MEQRIDTVFFDAGGVLVLPNWDRVSELLARHGLRIDAGLLRRLEPAARFALDTPRVTTTTDGERGGNYFNDIFDRAGVPRGAVREAALQDVYAYHMEQNLWEDVLPDVLPVLERLRQRGLRLAVASNANGALHRCFDRVGLATYFDVICDSGLEGVEKPDPRFFDILLERSGSRRETTLHVGDIYHVDVVGARNAGIRALLVDPLDLYASFAVDRIRHLTELPDYLDSVT